MKSRAENEIQNAAEAPPAPAEFAALEQQIAQVEETIAEIEKGGHSSVSEASERGVAAELHGRNIERELKAAEARIPFEVRQRIQEEVDLNDRESEECLGRRFPMVAIELLVPYLRGLREMGTAARERQAARIHFDQAVAAEATPLRNQLNELAKAQRAARRRFDDARWRHAEAQDTERAYRDYLDAFAAGAHVGEARRKLEDIWWRAARAKRTEEAVRQYLTQCWEGAHAIEARQLFDEIRDDRAWEAARKTNDAEGYGLYLRDRPKGRHAAEARGLQPLRLAVRRRRQKWLAAGVVALAAVVLPAGWNSWSRAMLEELKEALQNPRPDEFGDIEATLKTTRFAPWHRAEAEELKEEFQNLRLTMPPTNAAGQHDASWLLDQQLIKPDPNALHPSPTNF